MLLGNPRLYDILQARLGGHEIAARLSEVLRDLGPGSTLLDIGAGTGMVAELVPRGSRYLWLDTDPIKLRGFLARSVPSDAVLGDAARIPFLDDVVERATMIAVSHHLPDAALESCLREVARVTHDRFVFVDAIRGRRARSRLLWQIDRGRTPRTAAERLDAISTHFEVVEVARFSKLHEYLLCVGTPRHSGSAGSTC
jgi:SAM-dependent methyltransferase